MIPGGASNEKASIISDSQRRVIVGRFVVASLRNMRSQWCRRQQCVPILLGALI
jgi:hypothetical protein